MEANEEPEFTASLNEAMKRHGLPYNFKFKGCNRGPAGGRRCHFEAEGPDGKTARVVMDIVYEKTLQPAGEPADQTLDAIKAWRNQRRKEQTKVTFTIDAEVR